MRIRTTLNPLNAVSNPYKQEEILFESNTPGTYELKPKADCYAETTITGGGAGGAFNSSSNRSSAAAGSSASGCIVRVLLKAGKTYSITVGAGGNPSGGRDANTWGGAGGVSKITLEGQDLIKAPGGNGGHVWWPNAAAAATPPALCSFAENSELFSVIDLLMNRQGITGGTYTGNGGPSVIDGTTHGKGGKAVNSGGGSYAEAGNPGYVKIVNKRLKKRYYKYVFYSQFTQPVLASNGVIGGDSFAITASKYSLQPYLAVDGNDSTYMQIQGAAGQSITFYNPEPLKLKQLNILCYNNNDQGYCIRGATLEASLDGKTWTQITDSFAVSWNISTDAVFKYFRINITTGGTYNGYVDVCKLEVIADVYTAELSTSSNFDYVEYQES